MTGFAAALTHFQQGDFAAAEAILAEMVAREPAHADAVHLLASVRHAEGDLAGASALFERAALLAPDDAAIAFNRAVVLAAQARHAEAADAFAHALTLRPNDAEALFAQGASLAALRRYSEALACYDAARALGLDRADLHVNRGAVLAALERHEEAIAASERALALAPDNVKAHFNRGASLAALERWAEAAETLGQALARAPEHTPARAVRATALANLGRFGEALADIDLALARQPDRIDHWARRGYVLTAANRGAEAIAAYEQVLAAKPDDAEAAYAIADALLAEGDFARGLGFYEARWRLRGVRAPPQVDAPLWLAGEPIEGKRLLVQGEQGFGDLFQFCRFVPDLAARGAQVVLQERSQTLALLNSLAGVETLVSLDAPAPPTDLRIPMGSLMLAMGVRIETVPAPAAYLRAENERVARWRDMLGPARRRRIGICWAGGARYPMQRWRRLGAEALERLVSADADFVSLQMDAGEEASLLRAHGVRDFGAAIADFAELAALIETLDLVISIDTGPAHLAGALGKKVWILLPFHADWRWLRERRDSPWYPQARLFRQSHFGDWRGVMDAVLAELQE